MPAACAPELDHLELGMYNLKITVVKCHENLASPS